MKKAEITGDVTVDEAIRRWPHVARYFIREKLPCIGCPMGAFDTLADVAKAYGFGPASFVRKLNQFATKRRGK